MPISQLVKEPVPQCDGLDTSTADGKRHRKRQVVSDRTSYESCLRPFPGALLYELQILKRDLVCFAPRILYPLCPAAASWCISDWEGFSAIPRRRSKRAGSRNAAHLSGTLFIRTMQRGRGRASTPATSSGGDFL